MRRVRLEPSQLESIALGVKDGAVIVYPTDTVYGLGCDPFNMEAVRRIYEIKRREGKALPVLCSSMEHVLRLARLDSKGRKLASSFWPGPLTVVAWSAEPRLLHLTGGSMKIGVRIPNHEMTLLLIEACGGRLVGTSANLSGHKSPTNPDEILRDLPADYDLLIDGGPCLLGIESTVVDITVSPPEILREGPWEGRKVKECLASN